MADRVPKMLKVEEAAEHLRIGRTKAYALAQEYRITGGKSGLPVVDLGNVLRVPRYQLELLIGGPLDDTTPSDDMPTDDDAGVEDASRDAMPSTDEDVAVEDASHERAASPEHATAADVIERPTPPTRRKPRHRHNGNRDNHLDLFNLSDDS